MKTDRPSEILLGLSVILILSGCGGGGGADRAPVITNFAGGDYWLMHLNAGRSYLAGIDPATYTPEQWAEVRRSSDAKLGWGYRAHFTPPHPVRGTGSVTAIGNDHRHRVDQTGCLDCGVRTGLSAAASYTIGSNNRVVFTAADTGSIYRGAFSRDHNVIVLGAMEGPEEAGQDLIVGIKVASAAQTMAGLYAMSSYGVEFAYPYVTTTADPADILPTASHWYLYGDIGWGNLEDPSSQVFFASRTTIADPALATAFARASISIDTGPSPYTTIVTNSEGIFTDTTNDGAWVAVSPDGEVAIYAGGINDTDPAHSTGPTQRHHVAMGMALRQSRPYTAADVVGTYVTVGRFDDVHFLPAASCADPDAIACGDNVTQAGGIEHRVCTFAAPGAVTCELSRTFDTGRQETDPTDGGFYGVENQCFGVDGGGNPVPFDDAVCAGGRKLDVVVLSATAGGPETVKMLIGDGGDVLTYFVTDTIVPASSRAGRSRSMGMALRLR